MRASSNALMRYIHKVENRHVKMYRGRPRPSLLGATPQELRKIHKLAGVHVYHQTRLPISNK